MSKFHGPKESCAVELCLLYENCTGVAILEGQERGGHVFDAKISQQHRKFDIFWLKK